LNSEEQELILKYLKAEKPRLIEYTFKKWIKLNKHLDYASVSLFQINEQFKLSKEVKINFF
jgi:hypothetical protein